MTVQVLHGFRRGRVDLGAEGARAHARADRRTEYRHRDPRPADRGLSGGNQQKAVLARSFLYDAKVVLIDEPTQGVDANARFDIYRAIRAKADSGVACVVNSSDAMELAGLCDRVLVFSRGRVIRELKGDEITEEEHRLVVPSLQRSARRPRMRRSAAGPSERRCSHGQYSQRLSPAAAANGGCRWCSWRC